MVYVGKTDKFVQATKKKFNLTFRSIEQNIFSTNQLKIVQETFLYYMAMNLASQ